MVDVQRQNLLRALIRVYLTFKFLTQRKPLNVKKYKITTKWTLGTPDVTVVRVFDR